MEHKISIIIPAYNVENYLSITLDSVIAQTYPNIEVIVVNDGSTDSTSAIIDSYCTKDHRIKAIHKENGGVTSARLRGVQEASGDWIGFIDGDDFIEPGMYERLLRNALQYSADISHCGYRMVFPSGRVDYYYNTGRTILQDRLTGLTDLLSGVFVEPGLCNKLFHKKLFSGLLAQMDLTIRNNEDLLMNFYLFRHASQSIYEDFCPYHYVHRAGSATTSSVNVYQLQDPLKVTHILRTESEENLHAVILQRLTRQLITVASLDTGDQPDLVTPHRAVARKELRMLIPEVLRSSLSPKLKLMALWAAVWPASYGWVHRIYARVTGLDKKYALD